MKPLRVLGWGTVLAAVGTLLAWLGWHFLHPAPSPAEEPADPPWFADMTEESGLRFVHDAGPRSFFMPQIMGSGAALFDFDNDGLLDIYLVHNGGPEGAKNQLFRGLPGGRFQDVSAGSGLDFAGHCMGVAVADVNNDGLPDVLVTEYRGIRLFLNQGGGRFTDVTKEAGLANPGWGASAAFFDYDRDGWLDLVVVNYVDCNSREPCDTHGGKDYCPPSRFPGQVTRLFHNLGPARNGTAPAASVPLVRFQDVTEASGLGKVPGPGLGVVCADFTGDGWPDIFVANDAQPNRLWVNQQNGTFTEEAASRGVATNAMGMVQAGMGVAVGDVGGDGLLGLFVTHLTNETNTLWTQGPPGRFSDRTVAWGLGSPRWHGTGFGTVMADFDLDGAPDLAVVNGRVGRGPGMANPELGEHWGLYAERNQLFANRDGRFRDISPDNGPFCGTANVARGLAYGSIFNDGAVDLLVTTAAGPARLYRNVAPRRGHWLMVRAIDPALRRDAVGATVRVRAGGKGLVRLINPASSYLCSNDVRAHFGLGPAEQVDGIEVVWPDGTNETFAGGPADREVKVEKGRGASGAGAP
jgi:hypothetical protein